MHCSYCCKIKGSALQRTGHQHFLTSSLFFYSLYLYVQKVCLVKTQEAGDYFRQSFSGSITHAVSSPPSKKIPANTMEVKLLHMHLNVQVLHLLIRSNRSLNLWPKKKKRKSGEICLVNIVSNKEVKSELQLFKKFYWNCKLRPWMGVNFTWPCMALSPGQNAALLGELPLQFPISHQNYISTEIQAWFCSSWTLKRSSLSENEWGFISLLKNLQRLADKLIWATSLAAGALASIQKLWVRNTACLGSSNATIVRKWLAVLLFSRLLAGPGTQAGAPACSERVGRERH